MVRELEVLSPAGSYEGFEAALAAGADAVYVGGAMFGARAYAKNFQEEELLRAIDTAHIHGKKLYLTVNTLLKNKELQEELYQYVLPYYKEGLDAVIVQDLGVFQFLKENFPGMHLHASTQMTVTGPEGMKFLEEQGASRVVAARELTLEELRKMHQASPIEIEAFVHGALCYSYSGQCLMSSILGGRSGNRGRCAQPCRLPYKARIPGVKNNEKREISPLSLKDMNTIDILPEIIEAGVMSLKIEGRMKQPAYTAMVTAMYRKYVDLYLEKGAKGYKVDPKDREQLLNVFSRGGSCSGYYKMKNGPTMMDFVSDKKTGEVTAQITKPKQRIDGNLMLFPGAPAILQVRNAKTEITVTGGEVQEALNQPVDLSRIRQQMEKTGNTPYEWNSLDIQAEGNVFIPMKALNELRREALTELEKASIAGFRRETPKERIVFDEHVHNQKKTDLPIYVSCEDQKTAELFCREKEIKGLYLPFDCMKACFEEGIRSGKELYLSLPHIVREGWPSEYEEMVPYWIKQGLKGFLVRNLEAYAFLKSRGYGTQCVLDHSVYTWNSSAKKFWEKEKILRDTVPMELNAGELRHRENRNSEMIVYGNLPLMISAQCVRKNLAGCNGKSEVLTLGDRYKKNFPVACYCNPWKVSDTKERGTCYNIIYNSLPFGLLKEREQVENLGVKAIRLSFTTEKADQAMRIFQDFYGVYREKKIAPDREYTKGHFRRGAE